MMLAETLDAEKPNSVVESNTKDSENGSSTPTAVEGDGTDGTASGTGVSHVEGEFVSGVKLYLIVMGLCLAVLLVGLDNAILATAVPTITKEFHSLPDIGWYGSGFLITLCAFQPTGGKIYQQFNLKWSFLFFLGIFELGSLLCGAANSSVMLIIGRAVAGMGASGIFSGALVIISTSIAPQLRPVYTGFIASMFGISNIVGPVMGGALTQNVSWRWCFYINLPAGAITAVILVFYFHPPKSRTSSLSIFQKLQHLDLPGLLLFLPGIIMLLIALQWGGNKYPWNSANVIGLLCGFAAMIILFGFWEWYQQDEASIPPKIIMQRTVFSASLINFFSMGVVQLCSYYLPIWFQAIQGVGPTESGIKLLPGVIANVISSIIGGGLVTVLGFYTPFLYFGTACAAITGGIFTLLKVDTGSPEIIGFLILLGVAAGLVIQIPLIAIMAVLPPEDVSLGTTVAVFSQFFGGGIFLAISENIFANQLVKKLAEYAPQVNPLTIIQAGATGLRDFISEDNLPPVLESYNEAITTTFWLACAGGIVAFLFSFVMPWGSVKGKKLLSTGAV